MSLQDYIAVKEKYARYQSAWVTPIIYETYGRLAPLSVRLLEGLAVNAAAVSTERWVSADLTLRWMSACQRAVIWAVADTDLLALGPAATKDEAAISRIAIWRAASEAPGRCTDSTARRRGTLPDRSWIRNWRP